MCILFIAVKQHPEYPLIIAANRDEFFARPTASSKFWSDYPQLLAGRDLQAGGSWMAINKNGRLAALTNIRDPKRIDANARTRGELVTNCALNQQPPEQYLAQLQHSKDKYNGFNLLYGDWQHLWVYNNHLNKVELLVQGVYGLSNADLNSPWPKIDKGMTELKNYCHSSHKLEPEKLFELLRDDTEAEDHLLPQTGVPLEWERRLSSIFIRGEEYGTRSSTLLTVNKNQQVSWFEKTFSPDGETVEQQSYHFAIN